MNKSFLPSLDIAKVNFDSVDEINDFASLLINVGNSLNILTNRASCQSEEYTTINYLAKCWLSAVDSRFPTMSPADALAVIEAYEIIHRIAFWTPPHPDKVNKVKLNAFEKMIRGDKQVDEYTMYRVISSAVRKHERLFLGNPLTWSCVKKECWHREATNGFDRKTLSDYDILSRVNILLDSDLMAYEGIGQTKFKKRLFEQYRHYLQSNDTSDRRMNNTIRNFRLLSAQFHSNKEYEHYHSTLNPEYHLSEGYII